MRKGYLTVKNECENVIVIERSKFICNIKGIENELEAKEYIEKLRKKHSLANHSCYAYIADDKGLIQKFSDAGEPQGTAGLPMLEVLKSKRMYKTVAVVTRYFGGIKLGTGGLTRAYGGSVSECLTTAQIVDMQQSISFFVKLDYDGYSKLLKILSVPEIVVENTAFENNITVDFSIKEDFAQSVIEKITNAFNGKLKVTEKGRGYCAFK
ncbi:MAG: YigZ family protein [Clostridiales bacterium]|nr:YigZ family protein [Clostridiales bacterium]